MSFLKEYTILAELGQGGFAKVYKVRHDALGYIRAIRVLNEPVTDESSSTYQKFLRECKVLLRLGNGSHRNIVHIYQPRLLDNHALVEMDYVDGQDLSHYLKANASFVATDEVLRMVEQMSSALAYCHEDIYKFCMDREADNLQDDPMDGSRVLVDEPTRKRLIEKYKVIHNDIHSGNIMRREDGDFVLLDFGLAITGGDDVRNSSRHDNGAVEYKAPEKWDNDAVLTEQSDIYSFGVVMYEYLAGRVPFPYDKNNLNKTDAAFRVYRAHKDQMPPSIGDLRKACFEEKYPGQTYKKDYPDWLEAAIMRCLEKDPSKRFRNGKELHEFVMRHLSEKAEKAPQVVYVPITEEQPKTGRMNQPPYDDLKEELPLTPKQQAYAGARTGKNEPKDEEQAPPVPPVTRIPEPTPTTQKATVDKPKNKKGLWIGLGIAAAAVVVLVAMLLMNKKDGKEPASEKLNEVVVKPLDGGDLTITANGVSFVMKPVEGGTFQMGSNDSEAFDEEKPVHNVTVSSFYMGETEVTQALWQAVMGDNPSYFSGDNLPVERVSWNDCQAFIRKLNDLTNGNFRLPTEAEWEYAARGGNRSNGYKYAGSNTINNVAWYAETANDSGTSPVKTKSPNELGLYDMSGNVWEWCGDWYGGYSSYAQTNPKGPSSGSARVLRGGSWIYIAEYCRVSDRGNIDPGGRYNSGGFRLVLPQ